MSIQITATLDQPTLLQLLRELTPLTVHLGEGDDQSRWMLIQPPDSVVFLAGEGVRVHTSAKMQWTVASVPIGFSLLSVTILVKPSIVDGKLNIMPVILEADLKNVPDLIDRTIVNIANAALAQQADKIGWNFTKTLSIRVPMPAAMAPLERFEMDAADAKLEMRADALWIGMSLPMHFPRRPPPDLTVTLDE